MTSTEHGVFARSWKDIASAFLRLGATSYGGPAIMGIMQAELQEKRQWVSRERFVEGLSLVNMLPAGTNQKEEPCATDLLSPLRIQRRWSPPAGPRQQKTNGKSGSWSWMRPTHCCICH